MELQDEGIAPLEMRSNAPMPSIERTVARSSRSVTAWSAQYTLHRTEVRACWKGEVARSTALDSC